jgi:hypothetical protein
MKLSFGKMAIAAVVTLSTTTSILTQATPSISQPILTAPNDVLITPGSRPDLLRSSCADLAVQEIKFDLVSRDPVLPRFKGKIKITGIIKNIGTVPYQSYAHKKTHLYLYELVPGVTRPKQVSLRYLENVPPGATGIVEFVRDWQTSDEFPPDYAIEIKIPSKNVDCNPSNNRMVRPGSEANALFN